MGILDILSSFIYRDLAERFYKKRTLAEKTQTYNCSSELRSCLCTQAQLQSPTFQDWGRRACEQPGLMHRKIWEYGFIVQALYERGMLCPGKKGLGFAVGQEPLTAIFASMGCDIVATDLATEEANKDKNKWVETGQHAASIDAINNRRICDPEIFRQRVSFRFVDMTNLPDDLGTFDFLWSSSSLEHLGNMALGEKFLYESLKYLKPDGVSVHTTEYNVLSNLFTIPIGKTVLFRRRDLQRIANGLRHRGCEIDLDFTDGNQQFDLAPDRHPYKHDVHLKLWITPFIVTSFGLIATKCAPDSSWVEVKEE